jgi:hypothetical protein
MNDRALRPGDYQPFRFIVCCILSSKMPNKPRRSPDLPKAAVEALWQGNVIEAIKVVRLERNIGLKEAKDLVEAYIASQPALKKKIDKVLATAQQKFVRWLIGFLVLASAVAYLVMRVV